MGIAGSCQRGADAVLDPRANVRIRLLEANEMVKPVKVLATKPKDLSSIP